jgi:hypothetical protein
MNPTRPSTAFFFIRTAKNGLVAPRFLVFARIWAFIHPVSPGHPRPPGARSGSLEETNARERSRKVPARLVFLTYRRERAVVVLIASSSAHRLPRTVKACRRWTCSHAARRVNARPPIYRGLWRVWPHSPPSPQSTLQQNLSSNGGLRLRRRRGQQLLRPTLPAPVGGPPPPHNPPEARRSSSWRTPATTTCTSLRRHASAGQGSSRWTPGQSSQ